MLEGLHYKLSGQLFHGIEVKGFKDAQLQYQLTTLKATKDELNLDGFEDETYALENKKKNIKVSLVVNTEQVLSRISEQISSNVEQSIDQLFPNLDLNQFYYQSYQFKDQVFLSIARKSHIISIVNELQSKKIFVDEIILGNALVGILDKFSNLKSLSTTNAIINFENDLKIDKQSEIPLEEFSIEDIKVLNIRVLSFLGAVNQNLSIFETENNFSEILKPLQTEFKQYLMFFYGMRSAVAILLIALMINFYYFNSYFDYVSKNPNIENENLKTAYDNIKAEVDQKDKLISQILLNQSSSTSHVFNDLIKTLPSNIKLSEITYQPLLKTIKKDKPIEINTGEIIIKGDTVKNESFANWNTSLKNLEWVKNVTIIKFDAVENSSKHQFALKIEMKI